MDNEKIRRKLNELMRRTRAALEEESKEYIYEKEAEAVTEWIATITK